MRFQPTDGSSPIHNGTTTAVFVLMNADCQVPWNAPYLTDEPGGQKGIRNVPVTEQVKHKES